MTARFYLRMAVCLACCSFLALAQDRQIRLDHDSNVVEVQAVEPNIVRIHIEPDGKVSARTLVMDPSFQPTGAETRIERNGAAQILSSPEMRVVVNDSPPLSIAVQDARGKTLVTVNDDPRSGRGQQRRGTVLIHDENEILYGIYGMERHDIDAGILRNGGGAVAAGFQGDGGAPFFFTRQYGVLVDSDGGSFQAIDDAVRFQRGSRPDTEYFVIVGPPMKTMAGLATLTGRPPMPPTMGLDRGGVEKDYRDLPRERNSG